MKKLLSILTALCLICLLVPAAAEESPAGTWTLLGIGNGDQVLLDRETLDTIGTDMVLVFDEDGTFTDTEIVESEVVSAYSGEWTMEGSEIAMTAGGEDMGTARYTDGMLVVEVDGTTIWLIRDEAAETPAETEEDGQVPLPETVAVTDLSELDGEYRLAGAYILGMPVEMETFGMNSDVTVSVKDGKAHLVSTWDSGFVYEVDVETELKDGVVTTSEIDFGGDAGKQVVEVLRGVDGSLMATLNVSVSEQMLMITFRLAPEEAAAEPAA